MCARLSSFSFVIQRGCIVDNSHNEGSPKGSERIFKNGKKKSVEISSLLWACSPDRFTLWLLPCHSLIWIPSLNSLSFIKMMLGAASIEKRQAREEIVNVTMEVERSDWKLIQHTMQNKVWHISESCCCIGFTLRLARATVRWGRSKRDAIVAWEKKKYMQCTSIVQYGLKNDSIINGGEVVEESEYRWAFESRRLLSLFNFASSRASLSRLMPFDVARRCSCNNC